MTERVTQSQLTSKSEPEKFWKPSWWNRRTRLERTLCFVTVTLLLIVLIMVATLAAFGYLYQKNIDSLQSVLSPYVTEDQVSQNTLCLTPECVKTAAEILLNIDETVDPCDDFYNFACGGWMKRHHIPEGRSKVSTFNEVKDDIDQKLRDFLEQNLTGSEPNFIKMLKWTYDSCMDLKSMEKSGADPLKNVLESLGGWPVVEGRKWKEWNFDWINTLKAFRELGYKHDILMTLVVSVDVRNNTVHSMYIGDPSLGVPDRIYLINGLNDSTTAAYFKRMVKSAMLLGVNETIAKDELLKVLQFETILANFSLPQEETRNVSELYNKYTIEKLQQEVPQIPWLKYFNSLLNDEVYENDTVIVIAPDFLRKFADLITSTDKRVVANYMLWRAVDQSSFQLSNDWRDRVEEYISEVSGVSQEDSRWQNCLSLLTDSLGIALSSFYVKHYFKEQSKDAVSEIAKYIRSEFLNILEEIDWMGDETKKHAKEKANALETCIGYPKELLNDTAVLEIYKDLKITESYFENKRRLTKWMTDDYMSNLRNPNKDQWKDRAMVSTEVNAFAFILENAIVFPAGLLQTPFFNKDIPQYMNFGAIGSVIGHEITHGFDDIGRQYGKDGHSVNWWDDTTDDLFKKKAQCIIDLFNNYTVDGLNINGVNAQGENIADFGGLKEAYRAYQSWVKDHGEEQLLPGLKFTQNQMFWISVARISCEKYNPEDLKLHKVTGTHVPERFRIIGPLSNLPQFAKDFNCPPDSPMNRKEKCEVW